MYDWLNILFLFHIVPMGTMIFRQKKLERGIFLVKYTLVGIYREIPEKGIYLEFG